MYRTNEFASLAGVTIRALHHYDRLGLLKPSRRSDKGYRLYTDRDLARLEQIVVLKYLALPLKDIRSLLRKETDLAATLRRQQTILTERRRQLDQAMQAIQDAADSLRRDTEPDWSLFKNIIQEIQMQNDSEWTKKYYSDEAQAKVEERKALWSPELQEQVGKDWAQLFSDVEGSLNEDPAGPKAQALAARWRKLVSGFTGNDPGIQKGLNKMWADQNSWPSGGQQNSWQIKPEIQAFIEKAMQAGK
jgi:DNA-binding transcriptional MerR regulator